MVFNDPVVGSRNMRLLMGNVNTNIINPAVIQNLPVTFYDVTIENAIDTWGVEANYLHRFKTSHAGGNLEFFMASGISIQRQLQLRQRQEP